MFGFGDVVVFMVEGFVEVVEVLVYGSEVFV